MIIIKLVTLADYLEDIRNNPTKYMFADPTFLHRLHEEERLEAKERLKKEEKKREKELKKEKRE